MPDLPVRILNLVGACWCISALLVAFFFMEKYLGLVACPLCLLDRVVIVAMAVVFALAFLHDPSALGHRFYAGVNLSFGVIGIAISGRHVYLQNLPPGDIPDCVPDLAYMLDAFSLTKTLSIILNTAGSCAEISWTFLGLSIAQQTLLLFVVLSIFCGFIFARAR